MESADHGLTWSAPAGIVSGPITIGAEAPAGGFALSDVVVVNGTRVVYFNYPVADGSLIVGALPPARSARVSAVPINAAWMLVALLTTLSATAAFALRRLSAN